MSSDGILSVQFIKKNIFLVFVRNRVEIYEIIEVNKSVKVNKHESKTFNCPKNFEFVQVPEHFDNNIKIFFANMQEYDGGEGEREKQGGSMFGGRKQKKDVFGLYFV